MAEISVKILQLPKSTLKLSVVHHQRTDAEESSDEDEDDEEQSRRTQKSSTDSDAGPPSLSSEEQNVLLECVNLLNDSQRVRMLTEQTDTYLADEKVLYALCEICHNLMIYNKQAVFEYKYYMLEQAENYISLLLLCFLPFQIAVHTCIYAKCSSSNLVYVDSTI